VRLTLAVIAALIGGTMLVQNFLGGLETYSKYGPGLAPAPIQGLYDVVEQTRDGRPGTALPDAQRLVRMGFDGIGASSVAADGTFTRRSPTYDAERRVVVLGMKATPLKSPLVYENMGDGQVTLTGILDGGLTTLRLRPAPDGAQLLFKRGFHWINEAPFNR
jgi:hypothetical protein